MWELCKSTRQCLWSDTKGCLSSRIHLTVAHKFCHYHKQSHINCNTEDKNINSKSSFFVKLTTFMPWVFCKCVKTWDRFLQEDLIFATVENPIFIKFWHCSTTIHCGVLSLHFPPASICMLNKKACPVPGKNAPLGPNKWSFIESSSINNYYKWPIDIKMRSKTDCSF